MKMKPSLQSGLLAVTISLAGVATLQADNYSGNGNSSFGGPLGLGSLTLTDNGTTIFGTFNRGAGNHNDTLVIYIDSVAGGLSDTSGMDDAGDDLRKALSGWDGSSRSTVVFPTGFLADYGIAIHNNNFDFGALWQTTAGSGNNGLPYVDSVNVPIGNPSDSAFTFDFTWSEIGSPLAFKFVATYVANSAYRSNEAIGASDAPGGDIAYGTLTFSGYELYPVPEPSSFALAGLGALTLLVVRRMRK